MFCAALRGQCGTLKYTINWESGQIQNMVSDRRIGHRKTGKSMDNPVGFHVMPLNGAAHNQVGRQHYSVRE